MGSFSFLNKYAVLSSLALSSLTSAELPFGIIGGDLPGSHLYVSTISSSGVVTPIEPGTVPGNITSVAMNAFGQAIVGGNQPGGLGLPFAATISLSGQLTPINTGLTFGNIRSVAINDLGEGIIGGNSASGPQSPYAAMISSSGQVLPIVIGFPSGFILNVAINNSGLALIGGENSAVDTPYAAFTSLSGIVTPLSLGISNGPINSVALNDSGQGIIGGADIAHSINYAAFVSPSGPPVTIPIGISGGNILSVDINAVGNAIIGGHGPSAAYAAFVSSSNQVSPLAIPLPHGTINSVAINNSGQGIIGGRDLSGTLPAYAALVSPSGVITTIQTGITKGTIVSVAINDFGQGVIGGNDANSGQAYAAIISTSGIATPINLGGLSGFITTVAVLPLLRHIQTGTLSGNNLIFANYINKFAPQVAFYFVPSILDGTLNSALASAAPTRNAFSTYTASTNLFNLTTSLSDHVRSVSKQKTTRKKTVIASTSISENMGVEGSYLASLSQPLPSKASPISNANAEDTAAPQSEENQVAFLQFNRTEQSQKNCIEPLEIKTNTLWVEVLGALAYQKAERQTPGFNPSSGGAILGYDGKTSEHTRVGVGASYLYTHVHEKKNAGHSNINQEELFVYGTWEKKHLYFDASLMGGLFQIDQVRKIHMTGFEFKSKSHPHGWHLLPHIELGYLTTRHRDIDLTFNPFVMVDWANSWQHHYKEKGSGPFNAAQKSHYGSLLRTEASLRLYETIFFDKWDLIFEEKGGYVNIHSFRMGRVNAFLVGSPGSFTVSTLTADQNLGVAEFGMIFNPHSSRFSSRLFYQGEFGEKYQSHQVGLEFDWNF